MDHLRSADREWSLDRAATSSSIAAGLVYADVSMSKALQDHFGCTLVGPGHIREELLY